MGEDRLIGAGNTGDPHGTYNRVVVELVTDPMGFFVADGKRQTTVGGIGRIENLGRRFFDKLGNPFFQGGMVGIRAINKPYRTRADTECMGRASAASIRAGWLESER